MQIILGSFFRFELTRGDFLLRIGNRELYINPAAQVRSWERV